jgi:hypothetical protein
MADRRSPNGRGRSGGGSGRSTGNGTGNGEIKGYFGPGERLLYACRRHAIVLEGPVVVLFVSVALYLVATHGQTDGVLRAIAGVVLAGATGFFVWKLLGWWMRRYVVTNDRILLIEGVLTRRVRGLWLKLVIDTTYHRSLGGRLFGYGDLELNLSGQPGLRKLETLPHPDVMYRWIVFLIGDGDVPLQTVE